MFNPLKAAEMVTAIGRAAREAARGDELLNDFDRGQLMSAYSASRHLAIEIDSFGTELRVQSGAVATAADQAADRLDADSDGGSDAAALRGLSDRVRAAPDASAVGASVAHLLELCRERDGAPWVALRAEVRSCLRTLCDREVELLAEGIEAGRA